MLYFDTDTLFYYPLKPANKLALESVLFWGSFYDAFDIPIIEIMNPVLSYYAFAYPLA